MGITFSQFFPPEPVLTEKNLPSQAGKVFIVTGGTSGVGFELATILYHAGAKVYIAGRSEPDARRVIASIRASAPSSASSSPTGALEFLLLDLADLSSIRAAATTFHSRESRLDVLWNNAGVSLPPSGSTSAQGHELQLATNCLGPYLLTQLLLPLLRATGARAPAAAVRVVWSSSIVVDLSAPRGGFLLSDIATPARDPQANYANTKTGNWFLAAALARAERARGILSVTQNPGNLWTNLTRHRPWLGWAARPLLYPARMGAYTELWAGLAEEVGMESGGGYVVPWGRVHPGPRQDLVDAVRGRDEGGTGRAEEFAAWCEEQVKEFR